MTTTAALSSVAFLAPFLLVIAAVLLLVIEDRREARLHRRMARDLARPRLGVDTAKHFDDPRTLNGGAVPPPPSVERPVPDEREAAAVKRPAS